MENGASQNGRAPIPARLLGVGFKGARTVTKATGIDRAVEVAAEEAIVAAVEDPPEDTRAYFRGRCLAQYASEVVAASWDSVIFDVGRESLVRVPMMEPERGTKAHVGALFDRCESAKDLLEVITAR